jgi:hypothetical protein
VAASTTCRTCAVLTGSAGTGVGWLVGAGMGVLLGVPASVQHEPYRDEGTTPSQDGTFDPVAAGPSRPGRGPAALTAGSSSGWDGRPDTPAPLEERTMTVAHARPRAHQDSTPVGAPRTGRRPLRLLGALVMAAGLLFSLAGAGTWLMVANALADERITVAEDAARFGGERVDGPLTAYYQADVIEHHALEASEGKTYAELDREDPVRATVMDGSFLRASLFTSVVSFGVAAMAMGLGIVLVLLGLAVRALSPDSAGA